VTRDPTRRYPRIEDYGLIGDSRTSALVSLDGSVDWLCLPNMDSPSVFGRIVDWERGGYFQIVPDVPYEARRRYIDGTAVLETTFTTPDGEVALIDFMPAQTDAAKSHALEPLRALYRFVEGRRGRVPMRLEFVPRPDYGAGGVHLRARTPYEVTASRRRHVMHLRSDVRLTATPVDARGVFDAVAGERLRFALAYSLAEPAVIVSDGYVDQVYEQTLAFWRSWLSQCTYDGPYRNEVLRSVLTLKLLSFAPSGAISAAPTTSLPEEIGGERNWDYRFCWIRDAALTVKEFMELGFAEEAAAFVSWLLHATNLTAPSLCPLYTLYGAIPGDERELAHLEGYRESRPVRVGNLAYRQRQLDVYGELIDAAHRFLASGYRPIDRDEARLIASIADHVAKIWREPDNGIWEARRPPAHYTHSKVMAWDALTHAAEMAREGIIRGDAQRWEREAEEIRSLVLSRGYNGRIGAFTQTLDGHVLDASLLQLPIVGFIDARDPRMRSTCDAIEQRLTRDGFVRRYAGFDDGLEGREGVFLVCSFWLAAARAQAGDVAEARRVFEHAMTAANDAGLLAEEYDPRAGAALGNFPQGLSHIGLITAALAIAHAESGDVAQRRAWPAVK